MASHVIHSAGSAATPLRHPAAKRATLVFVRRYRSGASRRMESLVAWVKVTRKRHLDVLELDADRHSPLVAKLGVKTAPSLVLVKDRRVVGRIEGRASGRQIDELLRPHL
jgi:thioredoxin-like negative regulator of GroEL